MYWYGTYMKTKIQIVDLHKGRMNYKTTSKKIVEKITGIKIFSLAFFTQKEPRATAGEDSQPGF